MPIDPKLRALLFRGPDTGKEVQNKLLESAAAEIADQPPMYTPPLPVPLSARPTHRPPGERGNAEPPWYVLPPAALPGIGTLLGMGGAAEEATTYPINTVRIDNLSAQWIHFPDVGVWIPPFWVGRVFRYDGGHRRRVLFETPAGIAALPLVATQLAAVTFYEEMLPEVDGESLLAAAVGLNQPMAIAGDAGTAQTVAGSSDAVSAALLGLLTTDRQYVFNGTAWERQRTPNVFKPLLAVAINAETTVWTPAAGKRFRLMGFIITQTGATGNITVRDNTAGATILVIPATPLGQPSGQVSLGNGILSAAINNVLTFQGIAAEVASGFVYGTEE